MKLDVISFFKHGFPLHEEEMVILRTQTHPCYTGSRSEGPVILRVVDHIQLITTTQYEKIQVIQTVFPNFL